MGPMVVRRRVEPVEPVESHLVAQTQDQAGSMLVATPPIPEARVQATVAVSRQGEPLLAKMAQQAVTTQGRGRLIRLVLAEAIRRAQTTGAAVVFLMSRVRSKTCRATTPGVRVHWSKAAARQPELGGRSC